MVITGAGVSVSAGIPDFRSENGIYKRVKELYDLPSPEAIFSLGYFRQNPIPFFLFAKELWPGQHNPTISHKFIANLEKSGRLLRNYTQNIDNLERKASVNNVIQCHGSFATSSCVTCRASFSSMDLDEDIFNQKIPLCNRCHPTGRPSEDNLFVPSNLHGVLKPDITFFGESLPDSFIKTIPEDLDKVDLCIVMGSSMQVDPVASILTALPKNVPLILINREVVAKPHNFDVLLLGNCDEICRYLASKLGWDVGDTCEQLPEFVFEGPNTYLFEGHQKTSVGGSFFRKSHRLLNASPENYGLVFPNNASPTPIDLPSVVVKRNGQNCEFAVGSNVVIGQEHEIESESNHQQSIHPFDGEVVVDDSAQETLEQKNYEETHQADVPDDGQSLDDEANDVGDHVENDEEEEEFDYKSFLLQEPGDGAIDEEDEDSEFLE